MASYLTPHRRSLLLLAVVASIVVRTTAVVGTEHRPLAISVSISLRRTPRNTGDSIPMGRELVDSCVHSIGPSHV